MKSTFKRLISIAIVICVALSCMVFAVVANAQEALAVTVESLNVSAGDTVDVGISVTANPGVTIVRLAVNYDTSVLTLVGFEGAGVLQNNMAGSNYTSPYTLYWNGNLLKENITSTGIIGTLKFKVKDDAAVGTTADVSVSAGTNDILDADLSALSLSATKGILTVYDRLADIMPSESVNNPMGSIRFENTDADYVSAGLRFRGTLTSEQYTDAVEIGFIAAPYKAIAADNDWYQLDSNGNPSAAIAKKAVCFNAANNTDIVYSVDGSDKSYQLIITGLSTASGATYYDLEIAAVMYIKTDSGYKYLRIDSVSYQQIYDLYVEAGLI